MLLFLYLFILLQGSEATLERPCSKEMAQLLSNPQVAGGNVTSEGVIYPQGFFWKEGADYWGCPCNVTRCLRLCGNPGDEPEKPFNLTVRDSTSDLEVTSHEHFTVLERQDCPGLISLLTPWQSPEDEHVILSNGSLLLTKLNTLHGPEQFCLLLVRSDSLVFTTVVCVP